MKIIDPKGIMSEPKMDLYANEGYKVTVTKKSINYGYDYDKEKANKHLKAGEIYTVERTEVGGWHTDVFLKEIPGICFNSVHFQPVEQ